MTVPIALSPGGIVGVRGMGFGYQVRRRISVDDARHERVRIRKGYRRHRLIVRQRFRPSFRKQERTDAVSDVILEARNEASQIDAVNLVNNGRLQDFDTHCLAKLPPVFI